ncbi:MAG: hypothetical protein WEB04_09140 [Dehalococcoidia bacterium]
MPKWFGWVSLPVGVLTSAIGLGLYSWWGYRRGRRDGVGRQSTVEPYANLGWRIVGWGLVALIPFAGWYAVVHVPTLCYKHGLRVGAKTGNAPSAFTSLPAFGAALAVPVAAVLATAITIGVVIGFPDEASPRRDPPSRSLPVDTGPRLTGGEAAAKGEAYLRRELSERGTTGISLACDAEDFNTGTEDWIVLCVLAGPARAADVRLRVDDATGLVTLIQ